MLLYPLRRTLHSGKSFTSVFSVSFFRSLDFFLSFFLETFLSVLGCSDRPARTEEKGLLRDDGSLAAKKKHQSKATGNKGINTSNKKLLGAPGIAARSKDATRGSCITTSNKKLLLLSLICHIAF